jgi:hypothetical protein
VERRARRSTRDAAVQEFLLVRIPLTLGQASLVTVAIADAKKIVTKNFCQLKGLTSGKGGRATCFRRYLWNGSAIMPL